MNVPVNQERISYKNVPMAHHGGGGMLMPQTFGEVVAFSEIMARSQHAIPKHLRDVPGACLAVAMQAMRWEMDPFAVASKSYNVKDIIAYEAQLIAAVVHTRAPLKTRPVYTYAGEGTDRRCTVTAMFDDGIERSYESPRITDIKVKNSPLWVADPDQQQGYYSIRAFARRYCPEVILGVYTPEEAQTFQGPDNAKDITPRASVPFSQRIAEIGHTESAAARGDAGHSENPHDATRHETSNLITESGATDAHGHPDRAETLDGTSTGGDNASLAGKSGQAGEKPATDSNSSQPTAPPVVAGTDAPATEPPSEPMVAGQQSQESSRAEHADDEGVGDGVSESTAPSPNAGLPQGWGITYAAALRRAQKPDSLAKYATEYWKQYGGWPAHKDTPDGVTAAAIFNAFRDNFGNREQIELLLRELI